MPVRQWVLSLPFPLRYRLAYDARLASEILAVLRTVFASLCRRARRQWRLPRSQCGAVTFVRRFGYALNLKLGIVDRVVREARETIERLGGQV